jgi:glycosyltransferase involved in cell wall biosynthesis
MYHGNLAALAARVCGHISASVIWNIRGTHTDLRVESASTALTIWLGAKLSRHVEAVINNSSVSMQLHIARLGYAKKNVLVIPNGFDTDRFRPDASARTALGQELNLAADARLVGHIARLHPMKDHVSLLRAAAILLSKHAGAHFILAGPGVTPSSTLAGLADALGIGHRVHFLGAISCPWQVLPALDVLALTSAYGEGFPNVVGEAMSCGVPCAVTDVGDSAWLVGQTGEVALPRDVDGISNAMDKLLNLTRDDLRAKGAQARNRIVEHFSLQTIASKYEETYVGIANRHA